MSGPTMMAYPVFKTLRVDDEGAVTRLRLDRPEHLNALTEESFAELAAAFRAVAGNSETRALVLTGNGRGFCAGSDVNGLRERLPWSPVRQLERFDRLGREVALSLYNLPIPTIAAVNGPASGGGLSLALACDIRVASDEASVTFGYTAMGLIPDLGATYFLPRLIGTSRACRLLWANERLTASQALDVGLVDEVVPAGEFPSRIAKLAERIAAAPPLALRLGRAAMRSAGGETLGEALRTEALSQSLCLQSADHRACVEAFLQRRAAGGGGANAGGN